MAPSSSTGFSYLSFLSSDDQPAYLAIISSDAIEKPFSILPISKCWGTAIQKRIEQVLMPIFPGHKTNDSTALFPR
jgi:hypothetical protein